MRLKLALPNNISDLKKMQGEILKYILIIAIVVLAVVIGFQIIRAGIKIILKLLLLFIVVVLGYLAGRAIWEWLSTGELPNIPEVTNIQELPEIPNLEDIPVVGDIFKDEKSREDTD